MCLKWFVQMELHIPIVSRKVVSHIFALEADLIRTLYFDIYSSPS